MNDKFALLGVPQGFDEPAGLDEKFRELSRKLHPDRVPKEQRRKAVEQMTAVNDAYRSLKDPVRRAEHLLALRGVEGSPQMSPDFLEQTLEDREKLEEAKASGASLGPLAEAVREKRDRTLVLVKEMVARGELAQAAEMLARMKYYARYLDEVEGRSVEM